MFTKFYSNKSYKRWFYKKVSKQYMRDLSIERVQRGIIVNEKQHGFGVFNENFEFVKSSAQIREDRGQFVPKFNHNDIPYIDKDVVFVGNVYPQFGHFLLEHMNRAWAFLYKKYTNMCAVLINNKNVYPVPDYMFKFLEFLGIKRENIIILNNTTRFRNVYIPAQGFNLPIYSSMLFGKTFDKIANHTKNTQIYDKLYVSRTAMSVRKTYGEEKIQHIFEKNGFKIIYPEKLPIEKQISLIKNCKILAGCAGSALHLCLFMKSGGTVIQLKRNRMNKDSSIVQYLLNETKGLNSVFIASSVEKVITGQGANTPQIIGVNKYMQEFFNDFNFKTNKKDYEKDVVAYQSYERVLSEYQSIHGSKNMEILKRFFVRISACLIPGRENRGNYRRWLKRKLKLI